MPRIAIDDALRALRAGRFIIVVDDEDRENEGDLVIAAEFATPAAINFMAREGRGLICIALTGARLDALGLPLMVPPARNGSGFGTAFTLSVEARRGVTTGISAPTTWSPPATPSPCAPAMAGCWSAAGRPRRRSTWHAWPGSRRPG